MKRIGKSILEWLAVIGLVLGFLAIVFLFSLLVNLLPSSIIYVVLVWALGFGFGFWEVFWWTFLIVFIINLIKGNGKRQERNDNRKRYTNHKKY